MCTIVDTMMSTRGQFTIYDLVFCPKIPIDTSIINPWRTFVKLCNLGDTTLDHGWNPYLDWTLTRPRVIEHNNDTFKSFLK